jgi:hypothetical protein
MTGAGLKTILIAATALSLTACSKRDSLYLDHTRDEAKAPARHAPAKSGAATAATNSAKAPAT